MGGLARELYQQILRDVDMPVLCCAHFGLLAAKYPRWVGDEQCTAKRAVAHARLGTAVASGSHTAQKERNCWKM